MRITCYIVRMSEPMSEARLKEIELDCDCYGSETAEADIRELLDEVRRLQERAQSLEVLKCESVRELLIKLDRERQRAEELSQQLEFDRTAVADAVTKAKKVLVSRYWLTEGRGSYEWDDDKFREEFRQAYAEIRVALEPIAKIAADWSGCPKKADEVARARIDWKQRAEKAEAALRRIHEGAGRTISEPNGDYAYALSAIFSEADAAMKEAADAK